ncbi:MAG: pyridoxal phosphate-dependent class II aminotransferase [Pseudomonadota bacterium]
MHSIKTTKTTRPQHGGQINQLIAKYHLDKNSCLDLTTGVNPNGWPVPAIPAEVYRNLPDSDNLLTIAANYYNSSSLQVTAGSQQSIELLPKILGNNLTVGIVSPTYAEHLYAWQNNDHKIILLHPDEIDSQLEQLDCLVIVNPNNPSGFIFQTEQLLKYLDFFEKKSKYQNAYLIIDEAFMDSTEELSLLPNIKNNSLIILRSIGKFFGLAGIRCGFIFSSTELLEKISIELMPWSVNHPARWIVAKALADEQWIKENRYYLNQQSSQLLKILRQTFDNTLVISGCSLFQTAYCENAEKISQLLARQGVLVRLLDKKDGLRFGLPANKEQLQRLKVALAHCIE